MAIKSLKDKPATLFEIDLTGPDGNAFVLLGMADNFCDQLGYDTLKKERILREMKLTDYEGLLYTFDREFGTFVTLYR